MCVVKAPKIANTGTVDKDKPLPVLRNPLLDSIDGTVSSIRVGRNALRIDRAGVQAPPKSAIEFNPITPRVTQPVRPRDPAGITV